MLGRDESTAADYNKKNLEQITAKIQQILDAEAPIAYDRLMKRTLRAFNIARSSLNTGNNRQALRRL